MEERVCVMRNSDLGSTTTEIPVNVTMMNIISALIIASALPIARHYNQVQKAPNLLQQITNLEFQLRFDVVSARMDIISQ